jgi:hypothetical protein
MLAGGTAGAMTALVRCRRIRTLSAGTLGVAVIPRMLTLAAVEAVAPGGTA